MEEDYSVISFLLRGKRRLKVLRALNDSKPKTPKQIAGECHISLSNVSNSLAELLKKELIKCVNPQDHLYRFYIATEKGKDTLKRLPQ